MKVIVQAPRITEAKTAYSKEEGLTIEPKFYAKYGSPALAYLLVETSEGKELGRYIIRANSKGHLKMTLLTEVIAACDGGVDIEDDDK